MTPLNKSKSKLAKPATASTPDWHVHEFASLGTRWLIELPAEIPASAQTKILTQIINRLSEFDIHYSRFRTDSLVTQMATQAGTYDMPADFSPLWQIYQQLSHVSNGLFTPFIGSLLSEAGYDATYSLTTNQMHVPPSWETVEYNYPQLHVKQPVLLDFGAAGKGYAVDLVAEILRQNGLAKFSIDAGGDIRQQNHHTKLRVGLENPLNTDQAIGIALIQNQSICGSAGNRRKWGKFHHMINPQTLKSPEHILATWVVADSTLLADAISTCLFFCPASLFRQYFTFEHAIIHANQSLTYSDGFPAEFFT